MNLCAIICEYNPLHYGHIYQMQRARELSGCGGVLCLMSGNFVQRGEPAIANKYFRAAQAIKAGADIVVEMPAVFSLSSAEGFAFNAIRMLNSFKAVTHLCFGVESDDDLIFRAAEICADESSILPNFKSQMKSGNSYTKSYLSALAQALNVEERLLAPNNILAIEYLKALIKQKSEIIPIPVKRIGGGYHENDISVELPSATAIRNALKNGLHTELKTLEKNSKKYLEKLNIKIPENDFFNELICQFLAHTPSSQRLDVLLRYKCLVTDLEAFRGICGVNEGIENAFMKNCMQFDNINDIINELVSKRYTRTKINRILMCLLLDITKNIVTISRDSQPYFNVLAVKKSSQSLLHLLPKSSIVTRHDFSQVLKTDREMLNIDVNATRVYEILTGIQPQPFIPFIQKL